MHKDSNTTVLSSLLLHLHFRGVQAFCSSITGTLATMAVLKGVGVGDSSATPLAATLTWMLKGKTIITAAIHTSDTCDKVTSACITK